MKILTGIDIPFIPFGGSPIITNDWYSNLPNGYEAMFLTMAPPDNKKWWSMKNVYFLKTNKEKDPKLYPSYINNLNNEIRDIIKSYKPDILHLQHVNFGLSRSFCEVGKDLPKIAICHGTDTQYALKNKYFLNNLKFIAERSDMIVFPTINMLNDFKNIYKKKFSYEIVPHGLPNNAFAKHNIHKRNGPFRIIYAGRLNSFKGADIAISALFRTNVPIELDIYGREDEPGYIDMLLKMIRSTPIKKRVHFYDQVERRKLWNLFSKYDAIVVPSRSLEAFSLTSIEAQARGLVVIYGDGGGITNAVSNSGIKIRNNSPVELARILEKLSANNSTLELYRQRGYRNANKYQLDSQINRLISISNSLINNG